MDQPDREVESQFTQPGMQILVMLTVLALVGVVGYIAYPRLSSVFWSNAALNGFILLVFVFGVAACFAQVLQLINSVSWIESFKGGIGEQSHSGAPRLLAPLAALLRSRGAQMQIGATSSRSILDSVATRIDEARDITRYIVNLLIFLGLLGTFFGLATTIPAVVETIKSLAPREGEGSVEIFSRLMTGLEAQLDGMGVAFSSSLLGLAGSLVVGLLELLASHGQNRFYRELEEWLSTFTRVGFSRGDSDPDHHVVQPAADAGGTGALISHFSEQMNNLQLMFAQSDESRTVVDDRLAKLASSIEALTSELEKDDGTADALNRVAQGQTQLISVLQSREEAEPAQVDAESRMRLRSIDVQLLRILEEMSAGRQETTVDLRSDLGTLTNAVRELTRDTAAGGGQKG